MGIMHKPRPSPKTLFPVRVARQLMRQLVPALAVFMGIGIFSTPSQAQNPPNLSGYHIGCVNEIYSRHPDCVAAIHRYCEADNRGGAGLSQEVGQSQQFRRVVIQFHCFRPSWYGDAPLAQLRGLHAGCDQATKSQTPECMSAIHRWCEAQGRGGAGLAQEVGPASFAVACFRPSSYQDVSINDLRARHSGCDTTGKSQSADCLAAIHRWCSSQGRGTAGIAQEVGARVLGVACMNGTNRHEAIAQTVLR